MPRSTSPALIISSAASSESDAALHALHRPVVQVARDAVALGFDRGVRASQQPGAVLVAVLQELEQRTDRLVGDLGGRHVAHQHQLARRVGRHLRDARLQVERLPFAPRGSAPARPPGRAANPASAPPTEAASADHGSPSIDSRDEPDHVAERPRSRGAPRLARRAPRCRRRRCRRPAAGAPRTGAASRWPRAPGRAPRRPRRSARCLLVERLGRARGAPACSRSGSTGCAPRRPRRAAR